MTFRVGGGDDDQVQEADDIDAAIELAARIPTASRGGAIEVRPIVER